MENPHSVTPRGNRLRRGRHSHTGRLYLLTTVTTGRAPLFRDFTLARCVINEMRATDTAGLSRTCAFVVMPDHLHWLVELLGPDLSRLMLQIKSKSAIAINQQTGNHGRVWQHGFHDHALRQEEDILRLARYVIANPVRAGLVRSVGQYSHWDAMWL